MHHCSGKDNISISYMVDQLCWREAGGVCAKLLISFDQRASFVGALAWEVGSSKEGSEMGTKDLPSMLCSG